MKNKIESINIIGGGNVASVIYELLHNKVRVDTVFLKSNSVSHFFSGAKIVNSITELSTKVDLNIICVSDDSIAKVSESIPVTIPSVHTSGAVSIDALTNQAIRGVIYPFQTISKTRKIDLTDVPVFIEANSDSFEGQLKLFCHENLSRQTIVLASEARAKVHLAGVFANNFTTLLIGVAQTLLAENNLDYKLLTPLLQETVAKASEQGADLAQTGPARRGDKKTILKHMSLLTNEDQVRIYELLSELIESKFKT